MDFSWKDRIDGEDYIFAEDVNILAEGVKEGIEKAEQAKNEVKELEETTQKTLEDANDSVSSLIFATEKNAFDIEAQNKKNETQDKRLKNLEKGIPPDMFAEKVGLFYSFSAPSLACPYARIERVGGHSFKNNLFAVLPCDTYQSEIGYYNFTVDTDGRLDAYFGAEIGGDDPFPKNLIQTSAQYVSLSIRIASGGFTESQYTGEAYIRLTVGDVSKDIKIGEIVTFENVTVDSIGNFTIMGEFSGTLEIMVNEGNTVLPWGAYGVLHCTPVTAVESYGANLLNYNEPYVFQNTTIDNGVVKQVEADTNAKITFKIAAYQDNTHVVAHDNKWKATITDTGIISLPFVKDNLFNRIRFGLNGAKKDTLIGYDVSHLTNGTTYYLKANFTNITQGSISWRDMGIYLTDDIDYAPYVGVVDTFAIPAEVQALEGYGIGIDATVNSYIDFAKKKFVQECKVLRLVGGDTEQWTLQSINSVGLSNFRIELKDVHPSLKSICDRYDRDTALIGAATNEGFLPVDYTCIYFRTFACSTVDEWRAYLSKNPVTVIYQTTEPVVTDISDMISSDTYIEVEGGGNIVLVNEANLPANIDMTFMLKEE